MDFKFFVSLFLALLIPLAGVLLTDAPTIWPVSTLIYNLGLLYAFIIAPKRFVSLVAYNIIAATLFVVESSYFVSYYIQNAGFNEAFFYHLRSDLFYAGISEYFPFLLLIIACMFGLLAASTAVLAKDRPRKSWMPPLALTLITAGMFLSPPARALARYVETLSSPVVTHDVFERFPELRQSKVAIEFNKTKRPNIVLIYAESLEQRFFDESVFPDLLPNLQKFREQSINFSNVSQGPGSGWTMGGIVASQCGYPLTVAGHDIDGNDLSLFDEFLPKATCLGDLLISDGYRLAFVGGAYSLFAGKDKFLRSHGYSEILDRDYFEQKSTETNYVNQWGLFDDTLLDHAFNKYIALNSKETPFLLTVLTLDTHGFDGYVSQSCQPYNSGGNSYLASVNCTDQLVSRFIEQIRASHYSENTIIIVLSDHLVMRSQATPLLETSKMPKRLTFFVNTPDSMMQENTHPGLHYDIAPTILDLVGYKIQGQMGFGAPLTQGPGYLPGRFGEDDWREQTSNLLEVGKTLWDNNVILDQDGIKIDEASFSLIMGGRKFNLRSWGASNVPLSILFTFNKSRSLQLEEITAYAYDNHLTEITLSKKLLEDKDKLAFVISRAKNLPGFSDPRMHPDQLVYFLGKPESELFSSGTITGDLEIPIELIQRLSKGKKDDLIVSKRESLLRSVEGKLDSKVNRSTVQLRTAE